MPDQLGPDQTRLDYRLNLRFRVFCFGKPTEQSGSGMGLGNLKEYGRPLTLVCCFRVVGQLLEQTRFLFARDLCARP